QGVYTDSCMQDQLADYQCALFPALLPAIDQVSALALALTPAHAHAHMLMLILSCADARCAPPQFPKDFVAIADSLPCVRKWRASKKEPEPAPAFTAEQACPAKPACGHALRATGLHAITAPPTTPADTQLWMRRMQREI